MLPRSAIEESEFYERPETGQCHVVHRHMSSVHKGLESCSYRPVTK